MREDTHVPLGRRRGRQLDNAFDVLPHPAQHFEALRGVGFEHARLVQHHGIERPFRFEMLAQPRDVIDADRVKMAVLVRGRRSLFGVPGDNRHLVEAQVAPLVEFSRPPGTGHSLRRDDEHFVNFAVRDQVEHGRTCHDGFTQSEVYEHAAVRMVFDELDAFVLIVVHVAAVQFNRPQAVRERSTQRR
ncbi:hypothetical protein EONOIOGO_00001 [Salmonella phage vB_SenS_BPS4]|nr:hypothetical protein EONOIOGO_00001 [Salmonella phage vB_SenS_BPS4]